MDRVECIVIGAGVVGLAVAAQLARSGMQVFVLERHDQIGSETSARNSEVIHAGIYYPARSHKAELCVAGKHALYEYCAARSIPYERKGKLIVATTASEVNVTRELMRQGRLNGVDDLIWLDSQQVAQMEPEVDCAGGIFSPSSGVVDSHALMLSLQADLEAYGGVVVLETEVNQLARDGDRTAVEYGSDTISAQWVINCAGLHAPELASDTPNTPSARFAKGHYYVYSGKAPFSLLVYPVPAGGGLGIHATVDLAGQVRFGPDVQWIDDISYDFDLSTRPAFAQAIRRYYPQLEVERLQPGYTGIRPKIVGRGGGFRDFRIDGPGDHGVPGRVNLFGIESPGLTSALAIAHRVNELVLSKM